MSAQQFTNGATALLSGSITAGDTSLTLQSGGSLFPEAINGTTNFVITLEDEAGNIEIIRVNDHVEGSNTFNQLDRGLESTGGQGWSGVVRVELRLTADTLGGWLQRNGSTPMTGDLNLGTNNIDNAGDIDATNVIATNKVEATQLIGKLRGSEGDAGNEIEVPAGGSGVPTIGGLGIWYGGSGGLFNPASKAAVVHTHDLSTDTSYPLSNAEVTAGFTLDEGGAVAALTVTDTTYPAGDIRRYGADTSDTAGNDNTRAIDNACASNAKRVFIPQGVWVCKHVRLRSNQLLEGEGMYISTLKMPDNGLGKATNNDPVYGGTYQVMGVTQHTSNDGTNYIRNLTIDGNVSGNPGWDDSDPNNYRCHGICFAPFGAWKIPSNLEITNVRITDTLSDSLAFAQCYVVADNLQINDCYTGAYIHSNFGDTGAWASMFTNIRCSGYFADAAFLLAGDKMVNVSVTGETQHPAFGAANEYNQREYFFIKDSSPPAYIENFSASPKLANTWQTGHYFIKARGDVKVDGVYIFGDNLASTTENTLLQCFHPQGVPGYVSIKNVKWSNTGRVVIARLDADGVDDRITNVNIENVRINFGTNSSLDATAPLIDILTRSAICKFENVNISGSGSGKILRWAAGMANSVYQPGVTLKNWVVADCGADVIDLPSRDEYKYVQLQNCTFLGAAASMAQNLWWSTHFKKKDIYVEQDGYSNYRSTVSYISREHDTTGVAVVPSWQASYNATDGSPKYPAKGWPNKRSDVWTYLGVEVAGGGNPPTSQYSKGKANLAMTRGVFLYVRQTSLPTATNDRFTAHSHGEYQDIGLIGDGGIILYQSIWYFETGNDDLFVLASDIEFEVCVPGAEW